MEFYDFFEDYETIASFSPGISVGQRIHMNIPVPGSNEVFKDNLRQIFNYESSNVKTPLLLELDDCYSWQRMDNFVRAYLKKTFNITQGNPLLMCDLPEQKLNKDISRTEYVCYLYMLFLFAVKAQNKSILQQFKNPEFSNIIKLFNINISDGSGELRLLWNADSGFLRYFKKFVTGPIKSNYLNPKLTLRFLEAGYEFNDYVNLAEQQNPKYWEYFFELVNFPLYDDVVINKILEDFEKRPIIPEERTKFEEFKAAIPTQREYYHTPETRKLALSLKKKLDELNQELTYLKLVYAQTDDIMIKQVMLVGIFETEKLYHELIVDYDTLLKTKITDESESEEISL